MPKIFISYRRQDSNHIAGRINDWLVTRFGKDSIFFDVDSIPAGVDFKSFIRDYIQVTDVLVAVIGPKWCSIKSDEGPKAGIRKLDDTEDYLRVELETAISNNVPILPILVSGAVMPKKKELPTSLFPLTDRNAKEVLDDPDFRSSMERLFRELDNLVKVPYDHAKSMAVEALTRKIQFKSEFDFDACKLAVEILDRIADSEARALLAQVDLFTSGKMDGASFVTWLEAEKERLTKAEARRQREAARRQEEQEEIKLQRAERIRQDLEIAQLKEQAERERQAREEAERKLKKAELKLQIERDQESLRDKLHHPVVSPTAAPSLLSKLFERRTLKRPEDIESKLGLAPWIALPYVARSTLLAAESPLLPRDQGAEPPPARTQISKRARWHPRHPLQPYCEALRDRLIAYFEMRNLSHKPKLVTVTGCMEGAGVSTIAAGLAASLSETGEGNVLLVDMNAQNGAAHQFSRGDFVCGLDEALVCDQRESALAQDCLYVVSESQSDRLPSVLPRHFERLLPRLRTSDYDYIIFDMPPVSQISLAPRLARFMDLVLLVVESGKTKGDLAKAACKLLTDSRTNIGVVLNKFRKLQ